MKYFEIGMEVYDVRFGTGVVHEIDSNLIHVLYGIDFRSYILDGRWHAEERISLFTKEPTIYPNKEVIKFEKMELVFAFTGKQWDLRYYSHSEQGLHYCYDDQKKGGFFSHCEHIAKITKNPLI